MVRLRTSLIEPGDDRVRTYTPEEEQRLADNLRSCAEDVHRGLYREHAFNLESLCQLHSRLFHSVRDHAGRHRSANFGSERLTFGPNRSPHRDDVEADLRLVFRKLAESMASFRANPDHPDYDDSAIHVATWVHAELIRIHPFEDGNGRCCRLFANAVLIALGLRPIPIEACKQEYYECLNRYMETSNLSPLRDLYIRLYPID